MFGRRQFWIGMMQDNDVLQERTYGERIDTVVNYTENGRLYVRQQKAAAEKKDRDWRKANAKRKRNETLLRKSEPQTKLSKLEKKSKRARGKRSADKRAYTNEDVAARHSEILSLYQMSLEDCKENDTSWFDTYIHNYHEWSMQKTRSCHRARQEDKRYSDKMKKQKEEREEKQRVEKLKSKMKDVLSDIDKDFGVGSKIKKPQVKSLTAFFKKAPGFNLDKEEKHFNSLYFTQVVGSSHRIYNFTELDFGEEISDCEEEVLDEFSCSNCKARMIVDHKMGQLTCASCGFSKQGGFGVGLKQTFNESQSSSRTPAPYDRTSHVSFFRARKPSSYPRLKAIHFNCSICPVVTHTDSPVSGGQGLPFVGRGRMRISSTTITRHILTLVLFWPYSDLCCM